MAWHFLSGPAPRAIWAEFGAGVGCKVTETVTVDAFTGGVTGGNGIGTELHSGLGLRIRF
jgi:hypothetical protein